MSPSSLSTTVNPTRVQAGCANWIWPPGPDPGCLFWQQGNFPLFIYKGERLQLPNLLRQAIRKQEGCGENTCGRTRMGVASCQGQRGRKALRPQALSPGWRDGPLRMACTPLLQSHRPHPTVPRAQELAAFYRLNALRPHIYGDPRSPAFYVHAYGYLTHYGQAGGVRQTENQIRTRMRPWDTKLSGTLLMEWFKNTVLK